MKINEFRVKSRLPEPLAPLQKIAGNYWYSWNKSAVDLFTRLNPVLWERIRQNPVEFLGNVNQNVLNAAAADEGFVAELERVHSAYNEYFSRSSWFNDNFKDREDIQVAYFCCEYGIDVSLMIYSGGLGILSGDHLKSSSDLGIPLVGVGLLYQKATFHQYISHDGWQQEYYTRNDWYNMPVTPVTDEAGRPLLVSIPIDSERIHAAIWKLDVGKVRLYLLDTNIPENSPSNREITGELYVGDRGLRLKQELVLGVGGVKALDSLGIKPTVYHINEGHSAFLLLERIRSLMTGNNLDFKEAKEIIRASTVFTTHTPVPAGNEYFDESAILKFLDPLRRELGLSEKELLHLGRHEAAKKGSFCMTVLALKLSAYNNGVSRLHGKVSRRMWKALWPGLPEDEVPIVSITNGIHTLSWISHELTDLFIRYLGPNFFKKPADRDIWKRVDRIPAAELWRIHQIRKNSLISFCRRRLRDKLVRHGAGANEVQTAEEVMNTDCLTIGFARRFAEYKRASLIFTDRERLIRILTNPDKPVQLIIAGKAHPMDIVGKELIKSIIHFINDNNLDNHIVFLGDYDIDVARELVQGVDVWLNTPKMEMEASGTSGMKAAANGALNLSIPDGWWHEAHTRDTGWSIGSGEIYKDPEEQNYIESEALYNILEREVVPLYYERDRVGLPREWIRMMTESMKLLGAYFNTHRMVSDYTTHFYMPAHEAGRRMTDNNFEGARDLSGWRRKIEETWGNVSVLTENFEPGGVLEAGDKVSVKVSADLAGLDPGCVAVELFFGKLDQFGKIRNGRIVRMDHVEQVDGRNDFHASIPCSLSGRHGFAARIRPDHDLMVSKVFSYLLKWED